MKHHNSSEKDFFFFFPHLQISARVFGQIFIWFDLKIRFFSVTVYFLVLKNTNTSSQNQWETSLLVSSLWDPVIISITAFHKSMNLKLIFKLFHRLAFMNTQQQATLDG